MFGVVVTARRLFLQLNILVPQSVLLITYQGYQRYVNRDVHCYAVKIKEVEGEVARSLYFYVRFLVQELLHPGAARELWTCWV